MRKFLILFGALLCMSLTAAAQESVADLDVNSPAAEPAPMPVHFAPSDRENWQLTVGFEYQQFRVFGLGFHNFGYNASVTRYLNDWFGLEGAVDAGFGHTGIQANLPFNLDAKSLFAGGGPHIALSNRSRFEPWGHVLVGMEHFRFTQTDNTIGLGSNTSLGFRAGGGVDLKLGGRAYWRFQADYVESHFQSQINNSFSAGTGLVLNF